MTRPITFWTLLESFEYQGSPCTHMGTRQKFDNGHVASVIWDSGMRSVGYYQGLFECAVLDAGDRVTCYAGDMTRQNVADYFNAVRDMMPGDDPLHYLRLVAPQFQHADQY